VTATSALEVCVCVSVCIHSDFLLAVPGNGDKTATSSPGPSKRRISRVLQSTEFSYLSEKITLMTVK